MAYLTRAEFVAQSIASAAIAGLTNDQIDSALDWASGHADSYLAKRYSLPLTEWGDDIRRCVGILAAYDLIQYRGFRPESGNDSIIVKRYDDAIKWLENIAKGLVELVGAVDQTPDDDEEGPLTTTSDYNPFRYFTGRPDEDDSTGC